MSWAKLDDRLDSHPKFLRVWRRSPAAVGLWTFGLTYSSRYALAGEIPEEIIDLWDPPDGAVVALLEAGLWIRTETGYAIHDFDEYNPTEDLRKKRAAAGRKGGKASGKSRRQKSAEKHKVEAQ